MKQVNLYVWLVLSALVVLVGMMLISVVTSAMASQPLEFHACNAKTCAAVDENTQKVIGSGETIYLLPSEVTGVSSVHNCKDCTKVFTRLGQSVYILLTPETAVCVLFGGDKCAIRGAK